MRKISSYLLCAMLVISGGAPSFSDQIEEKVVVLSFEGEVKVLFPGESASVKCRRGLVVAEGTEIVTGERAFVELAFDRGGANKVRVREKSTVVLKLRGSEKIELVDGELFILLKNMKKGSTFEVRTPAAICGARGTGWLVRADQSGTAAVVVEDSVYVLVRKNGKDQRYSVKSGYRAVIDNISKNVLVEKIPSPEYDMYLEDFLNAMYVKNSIDNKLKFLDDIDRMREDQIDSLDRRKENILKERKPEKPSTGKYKTIGS